MDMFSNNRLTIGKRLKDRRDMMTVPTAKAAIRRLAAYENTGLTPKEIEELKQSNAEWERTADIYDQREYRKKFLELFRKERGTDLIYPDADEAYKRLFEAYDEIAALKADGAEIKANVEKLNLEFHSALKENTKLKKEQERMAKYCYTEAGLTPDCSPYYCVKKLKAENERLQSECALMREQVDKEA